MSERDEERPLSRRERRLRDMAAAGIAAEERPPTALEPPHAPDDEEEIEISPVNPDGTQRTRREMRQLRELALAERESIALESTQAFSLQDLEEATAAAEDAADVEDVEEAAVLGEAAASPRAEVFAVDPEDVSPEIDVAVSETVTVEHDEPVDASADAETESVDDVLEELSADAGLTEDGTIDEVSAQAVSASKQSYSFPDITPLDEGGSVFDDPVGRERDATGDSPQGDGGDFDEIISRAVAQEGSGNAGGASALILPDMGGTGQLSGPLGETGELFITGEIFATGSVELPKSLGETGGHAALLDSVQSDPDEFVFGDAPTASTDGIIAPVSASKAVSARAPGSGIGTAAEKPKSKLPTVLIATGGGLLVVVAGLAIWAFSSGFFA